MAERKWTPSQQLAIDTRDKTLLVSAAAGSGKTATLTERIIQSITDPHNPADISKMLIVTFTKAAAEELKTRIFDAIGKALAKNPSNRYLTDQLIKLGTARICTIDAFYLDLIRSGFSTLGISPSIRVGNTAELELLSKTVMEDTIEHFYETDEAFPQFAECLIGTRNADKLSEQLISFYEKSNSFPEGIDFFLKSSERISETVGRDFFSTSYGNILADELLSIYEAAHRVFSNAIDYLLMDENHTAAYFASFDHDRRYFESMIQILRSPQRSYSAAREAYRTHTALRITKLKQEFVTEETERFKELRTTWNNKVRDYCKKVFAMSCEDLDRATAETAAHARMMHRVLQHYHQQLHEKKQRRNIMDFPDIRRYTLQLLEAPDGTASPVALQYREQFTHIYIDEYQDVDNVQDRIFTLIAQKNNRFMVGDMRQSIYGFRGADPSIFTNYLQTFSSSDAEGEADACGTSILMSDNFRCDESIIRFTNNVCSRIFSSCSLFDANDLLRYSKIPPYPEYQCPKVQVSVLLAPKGEEDNTPYEEYDENEKHTATPEELEKPEIESAYIADEIVRLIRDEKKADGTPILPGDIAVLFRSRSMSTALADALTARGIASSESNSATYFENPDVLMVLCILNAVDNPHRDIYLSGALRSPIFGFTMNDILCIRNCRSSTYSLYDALLAYTVEGEDAVLSQKCAQFSEELDALREAATALPIDRFLRILFESERFIASGLLSGDPQNGEGNLQRLYEYARTFESGNFKGLYNFIEFINMTIDEGKTMNIPPKGISPDRVNLMTIHQSKGLEFPVCFVCGTANRFNKQDQRASLLIEYPYGVAMKISDKTGFARVNTPLREALSALNGRKLIEEEMRILYVALTRARERLYVTAVTTEEEDALIERTYANSDFGGSYAVMHANCYLDWILPTFYNHGGGSIPSDKPSEYANISLISAVRYEEGTPVDEPSEPQKAKKNSIQLDEDELKQVQWFKSQFEFQYAYEKLRRIPAKLSVSRLTPDVLDAEDRSLDLIEEKQTAIPDFFVTGKVSKATAAERGTATHLFLQFCDFRRGLQTGYREELHRLIEKAFIPSAYEDQIYHEELERFFQSELIDQILHATEIRREQRFNLLLSPEHFTKDEAFRSQLAQERLAVQGVIDLVVIDGNGKLCLYDYKTDRLTSEELDDPRLAAARMNRIHGLQLSYYAHAASLLFGRPCDTLKVYSTHSGLLYDIKQIPLTLPDQSVDIL